MIKNFFVIAYRNLVRNNVTTLLNVSGLSIGIAVCLIIGVWLQRELSFDNFHPEGDKIFRVANTFKSESESFSQAPSGPALGSQLPKHIPAITAGCRMFPQHLKMKAGNNQFVESNVYVVDPNFFNFFGFRLIKGDAKEVLSAPGNIVLTEEMAKKYFGKENPVGKEIMIDDNQPMIVSGIAADIPVNSHLQFKCLLPYSFIQKKATEQWKLDLDNLWVGGWPYTYIKLADPAKWKEVEKQANAVAAKFSAKDWAENKMSYTYQLQPLRDIHLKSNLRYDTDNGSMSRVKVFSIVGIIMLLLACINYINLTTASAIKRAKETSIRKVIGANKIQLVRQFFLETLITCSISVLLGVALFKFALPAFVTWIGQPYSFSFSVQNVLILIALTGIISLVAGMYPASILSAFNPATSLKGSFTQSAKGNFIRKSLVVFQFTTTIALVASILIISQQMRYIKNRSLGYNGNAVIEVNLYGQENILKQYPTLRNQLLSNPYILNTTLHGGNVVGGLGNGWTTTENLKGDIISTSLYGMDVDSSYLATYNMKVVAGRFFSSQFPTDTSKAVLVNEAAVKTFGWQKPENAIGKIFGKGTPNEKFVIGVVKDFNFESLHKPVEALMINYALYGNAMSLKIDANHTDDAIQHLEKTWKAVIQEVPLDFSFVDDQVNKQYGNEQKMEGIFFAFSVLSLFIACLGLFGLSTFVVERKVKEIGVRKVLGASVTGIVGLLSKDFTKLIITAFLIATPLAWYFMHNWLQDFAYRIPIQWWVFVLAGVAALFIALITVWVKAIKAALANPVKSLRSE
jgi:putative ABC transport system permease protein